MPPKRKHKGTRKEGPSTSAQVPPPDNGIESFDWNLTIDPGDYERQIERLAVHLTKSVKEDVAFSREQINPPPPTNLLDIHFSGTVLGENDDENKLTLRIRSDNLYTVGFKNKNGWWEFRNSELIGSSQSLKFNERYPSMEQYMGPLSKLQLNQYQFVKSFLGLRDYSKETTSDKKVAEWMVFVTVCICEATRLIEIKKLISSVLNNEEKTERLGDKVNLIRDYSNLCVRLQPEKKTSEEEKREAKEAIRISLNVPNKVKHPN